jgi:hypothetical protein
MAIHGLIMMVRAVKTAEASVKGVFRLLGALAVSMVTSALGAVYLDSVFSYSTLAYSSSRRQRSASGR